jgi:hypothetical protein
MREHDEEGAEWAVDTFARVNRYLVRQGLQGWTEPETLPPNLTRAHVASFPYSFLHCLRRAYAYAVEEPDEGVLPSNGEVSERDETVIEDATSMLSSHLLCHSDCEGLYVPVRFDEPLFADDDDGVPGAGMLGSSFGLLEELRVVAPKIGTTLTDGLLSDAEAERVYRVACGGDAPWVHEYCAFGALWEAASASIEYQSAIVFC